jgi:hypothetical protein
MGLFDFFKKKINIREDIKKNSEESFNKSNDAELVRYPENSQGDFYVENEVCINCGAPEAEAPDLIEHSKLEYGHCYFKKQPKSEDEIERAINAISVSCISGLRYGGTDEKILKRLYEIGEGGQCDHNPIGNYKPIIWDKVTFQFIGNLKELIDIITKGIYKNSNFLDKQIIDLNTNNSDYFDFIFKWTIDSNGIVFKCKKYEREKFCLELSNESKGNPLSIRWHSMDINKSLREEKKISDILWFDQDNKTYKETEIY